MDLQKKADDIQQHLRELNIMLRFMEGQGCDIECTVSEDRKRIDYIVMSKTTKFK